jgi:hypothetical protein
MSNDAKSIDELALEFAAAHEGKIRYDARRRKWRLPDWKCWRDDTTSSVLDTLRGFLRERGGATPARIAAVEKLCRSDPRLAISGNAP